MPGLGLRDRPLRVPAPRRLRRGSLLAVLAAHLSCSSSEPAALDLSLDPYAAVTSATSLTVTGSVTRTPAKQSVIVVRATGSLTSAVDTAEGGRFSLAIPLTLNTANSFTVVATEMSGAASPQITVNVRHDNQGPGIAQSTPADASDNVSLGTAIQVRLSERPVLAAGGGIRVTRQGQAVAGTASASADSLTFTFTPTASLTPNAIYRIGLSGVADSAGNASTSTSCFVTTLAGASASAVVSDSASDVFTSPGSPGSLLPPDVVGLRFTREGPNLGAVFQFVGPRTFSSIASNRAAILLDLDTDQNPATGYITIKDFIFGPSFPTYGSGIKAEYIIGLEPMPGLDDQAYVGKWVDPPDSLTFQVQHTFVPGVCGAFMGLVIPFSALGNDDGLMNAVLVSLAASQTFLFADPVPTMGSFVINLPAPAGPVADAGPLERAPGRMIRARPRVPRPLSTH